MATYGATLTDSAEKFPLSDSVDEPLQNSELRSGLDDEFVSIEVKHI